MHNIQSNMPCPYNVNVHVVVIVAANMPTWKYANMQCNKPTHSYTPRNIHTGSASKCVTVARISRIWLKVCNCCMDHSDLAQSGPDPPKQLNTHKKSFF